MKDFIIFLLVVSFLVWIFFLLPTWLIFSLVFIIVIVFFLLSQQAKENREQERERQKQIRQKKREEEAEQKHQYEISKNKLIEKYGEPSNSIVIEENNLNKEVIFFEKAQRIWLFQYDLPFSAILACRLTDSVEEDDDIEIDSSTDTEDILGRALVGGALFGSEGAIVGGATAKQHHTVHRYSSDAYHEYKIFITIDNLSNPLIVVNLDEDYEETVNLIMSSMKVIIERNKRGHSLGETNA